ncbi:transcription factor S [Methanococcus voltae]|uniref:Transcription factor S n=2 Tax=Methanococcus voltae TaxID=2188 RepID=A0A8J7UST5_METVO|nr:transcription factor S [Methanococcus voltae]MBP2172140.1 DNA-directed RNA polymerase subunit M [Methanococcus voltae]MBP2200903.1 DNA-directed RNA polymerase subunit M [Methanococcus voltae]MCS3921627.1 DNA-directed RNA polymerase subunit M [Methanococcus voltae PS]
MVKFCPKCNNIMLPKEGSLKCVVCGFETSLENTQDKYELSEKIESKSQDVTVIENVNTLPSIRIECPSCGNMEAYWWLQQTRCADEPETRFYKCKKCSHTWREYD